MNQLISNWLDNRSKIWKRFSIPILPLHILSLLHEEAIEKNIDFGGCYGTLLQDGIYAITNNDVEMLMHIQIFILVKASFF